MATAKLSLSFRIFQNGQLVREEKLHQNVIKIGKVPSAHLRIEDESVSRMHAIIEVLGSEVSVIDLGSTRGTFVNGQKINKAKLQSGDAIMVGDSRIEIAIADAAAETVSPVQTPIVQPAAVQPPALPVRPVAAAPTMNVMSGVTATMPMAAAATVKAPAVVPNASFAVAAPMSPAMFQAAMADDDVGAGAVEVAAMLGETVVNVKHCSDPRGGKVTPATWGFIAGGAACLLASAGAFLASVNNAADNKADRAALVAKHVPVRAFRPHELPVAVDFVAFGGLALGLAGLTAGLARSRRERKSPYYRIGTAANVEQPVANAPTESFPMVAPMGDDFVFNYGKGMDGELIVDGKSTSFADLVAQGRSRPSAMTHGAIEIKIPPKARIRARAGQTTFLVSAVAKPRESTSPLFANIERRVLGYGAASLAVHLGIVAFLGTLPIDDGGVNVDMASNENAELRATIASSEDAVQEKKDDPEGADSGNVGMGAPMQLDQGAAGKPDSPRTDGHMEIKNNNTEPQLSREQAIKYAQNAGVLGSESALRGGIASLTAETNFSSGFDDADIYGPQFGASGEGRGNFGFGRSGFGAGGGCTVAPCGIIGTGRYGTIGTGPRAGDGWRGGGSWGNGHNHTPSVPKPTIGMPTSGGNLDKSIIKRYIKRNVDKIAYCYESQLLAKPGIEGEVMINFLITGSGTVTSSSGAGFDGKVAGCVAGVIKNIEFPRPTDGGNVQVNYPFTFHASGK
jgi:hypothetical protein